MLEEKRRFMMQSIGNAMSQHIDGSWVTYRRGFFLGPGLPRGLGVPSVD